MGVTNKAFGSPDETTSFDHGQVEAVKFGEFTIRRNTFHPGWHDRRTSNRTPRRTRARFITLDTSCPAGCTATNDSIEADIRPWGSA